MIHINRPPEPEYFRSSELMTAQAELLAMKEKNGLRRIRFNNEVLKPVEQILASTFRFKCAYCESSIPLVTEHEIETFRPKNGAKGFEKDYAPDHYWWLAYEWGNLYLSCQICNTKYKCNWFPLESERFRTNIGTKGQELLNELPLLIDPCYDNPEEHLRFGADGRITELTDKGKVTIEVLGLNREELVMARHNSAKKLSERLDLFRRKQQPRRPLEDYINELFSDAPVQPYAAIERMVFLDWLKDNKNIWETVTHLSKEHHFALSEKQQFSIQLEHFEPDEISIAKLDTQLQESLKRFSIKSVTIVNFKSIAELTINVLPNGKDAEQRESWLLILGDNGVGKSSILQAIALALSGNREIENLKIAPEDLLKTGAQEGTVTVHSYEHDNPVVLTFNRERIHSSVDEAPGFIIAYGATRLLPKGQLTDNCTRAPRTNVCNLFDYSIALTDANKWLCERNPEEFNGRIAPALADLLDLGIDERISMRDGEIVLDELIGSNTLDNVSDGYKAIIAIACDIMKTLADDYAGYHGMQGIVLIDELGNHLHPRWRMKIVAALRRTFPKLQFIVSTHEPLCLRGLAHGEVVVLTEQDKTVKVLDSSVLPDHNLLRVDQLLTSDLFGLLDTEDPQTQKEYEKYYLLLNKEEAQRTEDENRQIGIYTEKFTNREIHGATPRVQALYQVINEQYIREREANKSKTVQELKESTVQAVQEMIADNKIDWL